MLIESALPFTDDPYLHQTTDGRWEQASVRKTSVYALQMDRPEEFLESLDDIQKLNYVVLISQNFDHAKVFRYEKTHRKYPRHGYYTSKWKEWEWKPEFEFQKIPSGRMRDDLYEMWPARPGLIVYDSGSPSEFYARQKYRMKDDRPDLEDCVKFVPPLQEIKSTSEIPLPTGCNEFYGSFSDWISCFTQKGFDRLMKRGFEQRDLAIIMEKYRNIFRETESVYSLQSKQKETTIINVVHYKSLWSVLNQWYLLGRVGEIKKNLSEKGILKVNDEVQTIYAVYGADNHCYDHAFWTLENCGESKVLTAPTLFGIYEEVMATISQKD